MLIIGDVHGKYDQYKKIIKEYKNSVCVGDMGVGFFRYDNMGQRHACANPPYDAMVETNARFIRGNHDNPGVCRSHSQWIQDGHIENNILFIGGAWSIDREWRTEHDSWWADEELSYRELDDMIDLAIEHKPQVIISHDCPEGVVGPVMLIESIHTTRTGQALERIRQLAPPKLWFYGHWHRSVDQVVEGTRFICLNELEYAMLNEETLEVTKHGVLNYQWSQKMLGSFNDYR